MNNLLPIIKKNIIILIGFILFSISSCDYRESEPEVESLEFNIDEAIYLYSFAFNCITREYPNKPGHVLGDESYLQPPRVLHPAFYGCFDWHSSVHGHWTLVSILKKFPEIEYRDDILAKLLTNITEENIQKEILYFEDEHNKTFQRTYGWAWLLKLDEALRKWDNPVGVALHKNLEPLSDVIANKFIDFLDVLNYPIRVGEHPNTAFGMSFAYDYAKKYNKELALKIEEKARDYYINDENCPLTWEPGGFDFISPCLQEASLMLKILPKEEYTDWLQNFLPDFEKNPEKYLKPAIVPDASDGKLAHLDGLNFSRAWCLFEMGYALDNNKMINLATEHFNFSYEKMDTDEYAGSHWLASFATYALIKSESN